MNVFIDANIFLGIYGLSPSELEELRKLSALIAAGDVVLWLPDHVKEEFRRNRARVLAELLKRLRESRMKVDITEIARGLPECQPLEDAVKTAQRAHSELTSALERAIDESSLEADAVITDLFGRGKAIPAADLLPAARDRRDLRRPPGKSDSLGDAVNWEALLAGVPTDEDLHVVSADGDFRSPLGSSRMREFLAEEWQEKKHGSAHLYPDLGALSKKHFPAIAFATDVPKLRAIRLLEASSTFAETHAIVARLSRFSLFTPDQARMLIHAAAANSQVRWIARDDDVFALLRRVIDAHRDALDANDVAVLEGEMHPPAPVATVTELDDFPF